MNTVSLKTFANRSGEVLQPVVYLYDMRAAFFGPSLKLDPHKLAVATLVIGLDAEFELDMFEDAIRKRHQRRVALIPPETFHHLRATGQMLFLYLDPVGTDYAELDSATIARVNQTAPNIIEYLVSAVRNTHGAKDFVRIVSELFELPEPSPPDPRIERTLRAIDAAPQDFVSVKQAADFACMSSSRFQHIFKDVTGTTFRRYRLWKRMAIIAKRLSEGGSLTDAALEAGFSSSSHLSSAFKDMFGIKPSDLAASSIELRI